MPQSKVKICQNCKKEFRIEPEDFEFYQKIDVPEPTFCPECRMMRRFVFRNERNLYKRKSGFSNKDIFSNFSENSFAKVYDYNEWHSDKWDPMDYGRSYDFNKSFFEQLKELFQEVPILSRSVQHLENSDYSMNASYLKNCYLIFNAGDSEDCAYGNVIGFCKDCYNGSYLNKCELCHEGFMSSGCYRSFYFFHCTDCQEIYFCKDCINCQNCFGCVNLRHKKYHIFNKPYTKQEYEKKLKEFNLGSFKNIQEINNQARSLWLKHPVKFMHGRKNNNVTGEYIYNSKDIANSYDIVDARDLKYCQFLGHRSTQDCFDVTAFGIDTELIYDSSSCGRGINKLKFCYNCYDACHGSEYCIFCLSSSSDLFGCISLFHKHHCILNKQYTKQEYEKLVPKIKEHMNKMPYIDKKGRIYKYGEFFPVELSPFAYNETIANEYFPLTKEQAIKQGYSWYDKPKPEYQPTIKAADLPDNIKDVDKSILKEVIKCDSKECAGSGVFRIIPQEYEFYKKMNLPLPRLCPDCRHQERIKQRNPMKLYTRECMNKNCSNVFQTTYAPDRKEIVYCEGCYNKAVG